MFKSSCICPPRRGNTDEEGWARVFLLMANRESSTNMYKGLELYAILGTGLVPLCHEWARFESPKLASTKNCKKYRIGTSPKPKILLCIWSIHHFLTTRHARQWKMQWPNGLHLRCRVVWTFGLRHDVDVATVLEFSRNTESKVGLICRRK